MDNWIERQLKQFDGADKKVLSFINNLYESGDDPETIRQVFRSGYCYYFAHMLKIAFKRGEVCWASPFGHFVWMDDNNIPYDIEGVNISEVDCYIPEQWLGDCIDDFLHVDDKIHNTSEEEINDIINRYKDFMKTKNLCNRSDNVIYTNSCKSKISRHFVPKIKKI